MGWCLGVVGVIRMLCDYLDLVRLDLGVGSSLDGDGKEVVGVVSCEMENISRPKSRPT